MIGSRSGWSALGAVVLHRLQTAVIIAAIVTVPLTMAELNNPDHPAYIVADWAIWTLFVLEYALALALATDRRRHVVRAWLPLLVVVVSLPLLPALFGLFRLARLARLLRMLRLVAVGARAMPALKATIGRRGLLYVLVLFAAVIAISAAAMTVSNQLRSRATSSTGFGGLPSRLRRSDTGISHRLVSAAAWSPSR